jgi:Tfp pilus assembly protein PilO
MAFVLTKKYVKVLGAIGCLVVAGLGVNFAVVPTINTINTANQSITDAQDSMTAMEAKFSTLTAAKDSYDEIKVANDELSAQFPENGETQQLIEQLINTAAANGIPSNKVASISFTAPAIKTPPVAEAAATPAEGEATEETTEAPSDDAAAADATATDAAQTSVGDGYAVLEFALSASGTSEQVQGFLNDINQELDRVIIIKESSFNTEGEGQVTLAFTAQTYVYKSIPEPTATLQEIPETDEG